MGKYISKPLAGICMRWLEKNFVYCADNSLRHCLMFWKKQVDDDLFAWKGTKEELELFVQCLNGVEMKIQFTMGLEKEGFLPFLNVGILKSEGMLVTKVTEN